MVKWTNKYHGTNDQYISIMVIVQHIVKVVGWVSITTVLLTWGIYPHQLE